MTFTEASILCMRGKRIRREAWEAPFYWFAIGGLILEHTDMKDERVVTVDRFTEEELTATDWTEA